MSATACVPKSGNGDETAGSPTQRVATIVKTRAAACKTARSDPLEAVSLCTSSGQCGAGSLCCKHWDENAGINVSLCQATTACPENEHCAHGQPCSTPAAAKGQASKSQCAAECERSVSKQLGGCDQKPGLGAGHCKLMAKGMVALCRSKRCGENTAAEAIND